MRYLTVSEALQMYRFVRETWGGTFGVLSLDALESALAQPRAAFEGNELHPTIVEDEFTSWVREKIRLIG